jgi:hypothetical protein
MARLEREMASVGHDYKELEASITDERIVATLGPDVAIWSLTAKDPQQHGGPEGTRTPDLRFRKALLYPAELPGRVARARVHSASFRVCEPRGEKASPGGGRGRTTWVCCGR